MKKYLFLLIIAFLFLDAQEFKSKDFSHLTQMKGFDQTLIANHIKLYEGYVANSNLILNQLSQAQGQIYASLKNRLSFEYDGMRLHELYFENLGGEGRIDEESRLFQEIEKNFGTFDQFKKDFITTGLIRGSGWVILYLDPQSKRLINLWINDHADGHLPGGKPLLVMDVWEHAYMTQFGLDRKKYIDLFFENIDWNAVQKRF